MAATRDVVDFLTTPAAYPHRPARVDVVQTHASYVFLAGRYVYKIKKPVDFGFLDFSTLARRKRFCEREVVLNRRLAPDVYLGVVAIRRHGGRLYLGGARGRVVEHAVHMRRLSDRGFASYLIARGRLGRREIDRIARRLAGFYREQQAGSRRKRLLDRQRVSIEDNLRHVRRHAREGDAKFAVEALSRFTHVFYSVHAGTLRARQRAGFVLDCHGDLRLEHVHLEGRTVRIYDCIEFNDRLRTIDVANDVAFLAMDLDFEGRPDLASRLVSRLAEALADNGIRRLSGFYACYRAAVRYKVEMLRSDEPEVGARDRRASRQRAARFLALALRYATLGTRPTVVVVMGGVATGKTTLAASLASAWAFEHVSSDVVRKRLARLPLRRRPSAAIRAEIYAPAVTRSVYRELAAAARRAVASGHGLVLDATYGSRSERERLAGLACRLGAEIVFIETRAPAAARRQRLAARARGGAVVSDARSEDFAMLDSRYEAPGEIPPDSLVRVHSRSDPALTFRGALLALAERNARTELRWVS